MFADSCAILQSEGKWDRIVELQLFLGLSNRGTCSLCLGLSTLHTCSVFLGLRTLPSPPPPLLPLLPLPPPPPPHPPHLILTRGRFGQAATLPPSGCSLLSFPMSCSGFLASRSDMFGFQQEVGCSCSSPAMSWKRSGFQENYLSSQRQGQVQGKEESHSSAQSLRLKRERPGNVKQVIEKP